jgi:hypothetical protein
VALHAGLASADDLLAGGPEQLDRLHAFATLSARRATAAANDFSEPEPARLARTAAAVPEPSVDDRHMLRLSPA